MSKIGVHRGSGALGPIKLFDGVATTSESGALASYDLEAPCRFFSLQVEGGTDAVVGLNGHLTGSSDSTGGIVLIAWSSDAVGTLLSTESTGPISRVSASYDGGASSATFMSAWFSASP